MYQIIEIREFYGPRTERQILCNPLGEPETFVTGEEAQKRIEELNATPYTLKHNEASRPDYEVTKKGKQSA
jgi:hypothetical protein